MSDQAAMDWVDMLHLRWPDVTFEVMESNLYEVIDQRTGGGADKEVPDTHPFNELQTRALDIFPKAQLGEENDGQLVIYTGFYRVPGGENYDEFGNDLYADKEPEE
jgi:hypothetical protein